MSSPSSSVFLYTSLLVSLLAATSSYAASDALTSQLLAKLGMAAEASTCGGETNYCPLSTVPNYDFSLLGGAGSSSGAACCKSNYVRCQDTDKTQYCKPLVTYTIPDSFQAAADVCPPVENPQCRCSSAFGTEPSLELTLCPAKANCCPECACHGDPHCSSFAGKTDLWVTCDSRNTACLHTTATCATRTYQGTPCVWHAGGAAGGQCVRDDTLTSIPLLDMYSKQYLSYTDANDQVLKSFNMTLELGTYGSLSGVIIRDAGQLYTFGFNTHGCTSPGKYPIVNGLVTIRDLPSDVEIVLQCHMENYATGNRWDVLTVRDPWFWATKLPPRTVFDGFCATGILEEAIEGEKSGACALYDRIIANYYACTSAINTCKTRWCSANYNRIFLGVGTNSVRKAQCTKYLKASSSNWVAAVCTMSPKVGLPQPADPNMCESNDKCKFCMDSVIDFPDIAAMGQWFAPALLATSSPTNGCDNLIQTGIVRKSLLFQASGIQINHYDAAAVEWVPIFALLDSEIEECGCADITVNSTGNPEYKILALPGKYQVQQCAGYDPAEDQALCSSNPGYNVTVEYIGDGPSAVSASYGELWGSGAIRCSEEVYPKCPANYACCIWTTASAWKYCVVSAYGPNFYKDYPGCKGPVV